MNPKKRVRVEFGDLDEATCARIGGKKRDERCVVETEAEVLEDEGAEGQGEQE